MWEFPSVVTWCALTFRSQDFQGEVVDSKPVPAAMVEELLRAKREGREGEVVVGEEAVRGMEEVLQGRGQWDDEEEPGAGASPAWQGGWREKEIVKNALREIDRTASGSLAKPGGKMGAPAGKFGMASPEGDARRGGRGREQAQRRETAARQRREWRVEVEVSRRRERAALQERARRAREEEEKQGEADEVQRANEAMRLGVRRAQSMVRGPPVS